VQSAKDATAKVLEEGVPELETASVGALRELLGKAGPPHYFAVLGYVKPSEDFDDAVAELRTAVRDATRATTTFGYGPRYLHSTGQFHKGGPPTGLFLELVHDAGEDIEIPGAGYTFRTLKHAQAIGDLNTLREKGLPAEHVRLGGDDAAAALRSLTRQIKEML
jgi:hypothetical protein